ncbi:hypothetical protein TNCV_1690481 [Trichonephila clavipes]|nr:hypothetical protein TNCV_1690481 [Trichonephila clavipes]
MVLKSPSFDHDMFLGTERHSQMYQSGGQSDAKPPVCSFHASLMQQRRKKHYNSITDMMSWSAPLHGKSSGSLGFKPVTRQRWPRVRYHDHSPTAEYYYGNKSE